MNEEQARGCCLGIILIGFGIVIGAIGMWVIL